jgi:hypothetical protein
MVVKIIKEFFALLEMTECNGEKEVFLLVILIATITNQNAYL